ncbi:MULTISPECIES: hypothetical protein [unclassified Chelatococcus]|uniref:hypothetical protein n=1 Tax=unclassified Chelatococcus TaxID=2638111 RepID=UPI001BCB5704|nr:MULTISPECIES: hypothetical protein [unclassified Chelatococcus]CAH1648774.1 conserved hypothetical protein [Hyphomicrobiales bacterium]MBS7741869.1 hypothetical protein [Chelatococcus sp. HY11]MBX3541333.1 hypothetical protein [Chelatococcus sp.]MCO5074773.1 hypothetical protein [Chelatococcus sp.]CAH1691394.1 conserved hypothetical protein [Hyphomicrobiales bacterium]
MSDSTFEDFISDLGLYHSSNRYDNVNKTNHLGRFQFGEAALIDIGMVRNDGKPFNNDFSGGWTGKHGIYSREAFLASHEAQDNAIRDFLGKQTHFLRDFIHYDGQTINDHQISISGLLAAAHLAGAGGVRRFLKSGGEYNPKDSSGTALTDSLDCFHGYDVPYKVDERRDYTFIGSEGPDTIFGYSGKDLFVARGGDDRFDGGEGEDTIELPGTRPEFALTREPDSSIWWIKHRTDAGCDEYKVIRNVELIKFADGEIVDLRTLPSTATSREPIVVYEPHPAEGLAGVVTEPSSTPIDHDVVESAPVMPVGLPAAPSASDVSSL